MSWQPSAGNTPASAARRASAAADARPDHRSGPRQMTAGRASDEQVFRPRRQEERQEPAKGSRMVTHPLQRSQHRRSCPWHVLSWTAACSDIQALQPRGLRLRATDTHSLHPRRHLSLAPRQEPHFDVQPRPVETQPVRGRLRPAEAGILHQERERFRDGTPESLLRIDPMAHPPILQHPRCRRKAITRRTFKVTALADPDTRTALTIASWITRARARTGSHEPQS